MLVVSPFAYNMLSGATKLIGKFVNMMVVNMISMGKACVSYQRKHKLIQESVTPIKIGEGRVGEAPCNWKRHGSHLFVAIPKKIC